MASQRDLQSIRLKGLVSRMQRVREQLVAGIPEDEADAFRTQIEDTLKQVERVCAAHRATPRQLPAPSYQAYRFLKALDLDHLPMRDPGKAPSAPPLQVRNILRQRQWVQAELARLAISAAGTMPLLPELDPQWATLIAQVQTIASRIETIAHAAGSQVSRLALPSRRAYEWFKFLSSPENLQLHLHALRCAYLVLKEIQGQKRFAGMPWQLSLEFYQTESDWRVHRKGNQIHASFNEAFVVADTTVLDALVRLAFVARRKRFRQIVREYSAGPEFAETLQALELPTAELEPNVRGQHYDLRQVFDRVNETYFDERLTPPRLTWNKSATFRVMGHYEYATDRVMISISLDRADIPVYVMDHVMHHELLHRVMRPQVMNGRLYSHTPAFREAERRFPDFERADAFLNQLSATLRRRT